VVIRWRRILGIVPVGAVKYTSVTGTRLILGPHANNGGLSSKTARGPCNAPGLDAN